MTETRTLFQDFDDVNVYNRSKERAEVQSTGNFVVEFGKDGARIAFNVAVDGMVDLLKEPAPTERPVRWINVWAPQKQTDVVKFLGNHYKFSPRLLAIICSDPPGYALPLEKPGRRSKGHSKKVDVEVGATSTNTPGSRPRKSNALDQSSHFAIVSQMMNYQSVDVGPHYLCVGANWMHELESTTAGYEDKSIIDEGNQRRLWSWLVLCDDHTVLSFHEDPGTVFNIKDLKSMRANTLSVLSQLSCCGHDPADPISMQTVRQSLKLDPNQAFPGVEGASNLFYYLFDDWRAVYKSIAMFRNRLDGLQNEIFNDMSRRTDTNPNMKIIPRLHVLGRQTRQMKHLYEGYANIIMRILEPKSTLALGAMSPRSLSMTVGELRPQGVHLAQSALQRFERLGDRIQLLILSETQEFLEEKEALISTYFNINAQKDSEATARLTRSATLLAKLSVLFLPVSLMTSYFSIQIADLQGVYTAKDYWYSFAVILSASFLSLFFFSKLLMWVTESLDSWVKKMYSVCKGLVVRRRRGDEDDVGGGGDGGGSGSGSEDGVGSVVKVG